MSNFSKLLSVARLLEKKKHIHYISNGKRRILCTLKNILKADVKGNKVLDIGGHEDISGGLGYSFKEFTQKVFPCDYKYVTRNNFDMRYESLPFKNDTFDLVVCSETIEHLWTEKRGGMMNWNGVLNFWKESYRVLKPKGTFLVNTRNRFSVFSFLNVIRGEEMSIAFSSPTRCGHVREFSATDFRRISQATNLFLDHKIWSERSVTIQEHNRAECHLDNIQNLLGRKILQEERYDTIFFKSSKT
jgi:SAM-dependent methyltransferase